MGISEIKIGEHEIVAAGSVLSYDDKTISLKVVPEPDNQIDFKFAFKTNSVTENKPRLYAETAEDTGIVTIWLENFISGMGGSERPIKMAESATKELWLYFVVTSSGDNKMLNYTFFIKPRRPKKEKKNGSKRKK